MHWEKGRPGSGADVQLATQKPIKVGCFVGGRLDINAALPRVSDYVKTFLKDWERLSGSGRFDLNRLKEVMMLLVSNDGALAPEWLDHPLKRQLGWLSRVPFRQEISCWFG